MPDVKRSVHWFSRGWKILFAALALCGLIGSLGLWVWTSGVYYRSLPTPAIAVSAPAVVVQAVLAARIGVEWLRHRVKPHRPATGRPPGGHRS